MLTFSTNEVWSWRPFKEKKSLLFFVAATLRPLMEKIVGLRSIHS